MAYKNFKDLEKLIISERGNGSEVTKKHLNDNFNTISLLTNLFDLYIPKAAKVLQSLEHTTLPQDNQQPGQTNYLKNLEDEEK